MTTLEEHVARAVREEIVRQYRDDDRGKCPAGADYFEEHIGPEYIARAAIAAVREREGEWGDHPDGYWVASSSDPGEAMRAPVAAPQGVAAQLTEKGNE